MIAAVARKELRQTLRDRRFQWAGLAVLSLLLAAIGVGRHHQRSMHAQEESARRLTREQWLAQGEKNPHSAAHYGTYAVRPRSALSLLDGGVEAYTGVAIWLEAHKQNDFRFRPAADATAARRFGELSAATVLTVLLPLLVVLLAFDAFTSERERGTLRLLVSLGVSTSRLAAGKVAGLCAGLALLLAPALALGCAVLATAPAADGRAPWTRFLVFVAAHGAHLAVVALLSLAVSAWAPSSRASLVVLLGFWAANTLLVPRLAVDLASALHPSPTGAAFADALARDLQNGPDGHGGPAARQAALRERVLRQYGVSRVEDLPVAFAGLALQDDEEHGYTVFERHFGRLWDTFERQDRLALLAAAVAPSLAVRSVSMAMAESDFGHHRRFATAAEAHRRTMIRTMNDAIARDGKGRDGFRAGPELWRRVPGFSYGGPTVSWSIARQLGPLAILAAWTVLSAVALAGAVRRLRVV